MVSHHSLSHILPGKNYLNLFDLMEFSIKFDTIKSGWSIIYIEGSEVDFF